LDVSVSLEVAVTEQPDGRRVVSLTGELDLATAPKGMAVLVLAIDAAGPEGIIIDLTNLRFIDANGLRVLLRAMEHAEELHRSLRAHNPRGDVDMILRLTGLAQALGISEVPADARSGDCAVAAEPVFVAEQASARP